MTVIGIFPAAGALGGATYTHLVHSSGFDPKSVVLVSRHPEKLDKEKQAGATCRRADFDDEESFEGAFKGIDVLNLISYPTFEHHHRFEVAKAAIDAAVAQGVKHVVYSSLAFARDGTPTFKPHVMLAHLDTEAYLASLVSPNFSYTVVRQGLYSESFPIYTANFDLQAASTSPETEFNIRIPHDGSSPGIAWAKREELGEATSKLLVDYANDPSSFAFNNKLIILSGPRSYSLSETAEVISRVLGKTVRIQQVTTDEYCEKKGVAYGSDTTEMNRLWATAFEGVKAGEAATVTDHLRELLGREPEDFEITLRGMVEGR